MDFTVRDNQLSDTLNKAHEGREHVALLQVWDFKSCYTLLMTATITANREG